MRFRTSLASAILIAVPAFATGCGGSSDETHGVGDSGAGKGGKGAGGSIPIGGTGGTLPPQGGTGGATAGVTGTGGSDMCAKSTSTAMPAAPVLMFLVDTSQSMTEMAPGGGGSKWVVTQGALGQAFMTVQDGTNVGLIFYPDVPTNSMPCFDGQIDVNVGALDAAQRGLLDTALQMAGPSGSTPTHDAYAYAVEQLRASTLPGQKYVVLITDGVPTYALGCMGTGQPMQMPPTPTQPLIDAAGRALTDDGIRTFVIGSPGSEDARPSLSAMASQGGTARAGCSDAGPAFCHLDMTTEPNFGAALNDALGDVIAGIPLSCEFPLPPAPGGMEIDRTKVNVTYNDGAGNDVDLGQDPSCAVDGWKYTSDMNSIQLCGALCDQVKADADASISIVIGCATRPVVQ